MLFRFYCDESYDGCPPSKARRNSALPSYEPRTYVVAGFFSDERTWDDLESRWSAVNDTFHVPRFHASHLNGKKHEYEGWDDQQKIAYSAELLRIIRAHGKMMHAFTCGMLADKYRDIISDAGREKLGHPYLACFGTCIARVADAMDQGRFSSQDRIAVIIDRNEFQAEAVKLFNHLKDNPQFPYHHRLATCTPGDSGEIPALQTADLIAYEVFKRLDVNRDTNAAEMRKVFSLLVETIGYDGGNYFSERILRELKPGIESAVCRPGGLVVIPPQEETGAELK
ncbi:MAG: DUF3800 domain-containing protein [Bryobacteraceae bacterium]